MVDALGTSPISMTRCLVCPTADVDVFSLMLLAYKVVVTLAIDHSVTQTVSVLTAIQENSSIFALDKPELEHGR